MKLLEPTPVDGPRGNRNNSSVDCTRRLSRRTRFRTGVRFSSSPPSVKCANTFLNTIRFAVFGNEFGIMVDIADYDTDFHLQTKKATYKDIQDWIRENFDGTAVTNLDISRVKKRCGLSQHEYKGHQASEGYYVPKHREHKEALIIEAFNSFIETLTLERYNQFCREGTKVFHPFAMKRLFYLAGGQHGSI